MKFYNRKSELEELHLIENLSNESAQLAVVVGRRRVGKTTLLRHAFTQIPVLYFFIGKKNEILLCEEFTTEVSEKLNENLGHFENFSELFRTLMEISQRKNFTLIIDEFQEFLNINPSVFSDMQHIWDSHKENSKMNLAICGSIYSLMKRIFENAKEPLYGRATSRMLIKPFRIHTIKEILSDYNPSYSPEDLLAFYMITGGVAKYIEQLVIRKAFTKQAIFKTIFKEGSYFLEEGKSVLVDEFGKDYGNYFSVLSLIANSKTERGAIESTLNMPVGGFLDKLEKEYNLIKKVRPYMAKEGSRSNRYRIEDNFLNFWFRFIYPHLSALYMMSAEEFYDTYIEPGLNTYLNRYFVGVCMEYLWLLNLTGKLPLHIKKMGTWIGKTGNIDIIAQNEVRENLVGLCNWEKPQVTMEMCEELFANMKKAKISANYYFLFSASTFEQAVVEMAEQDKRFVLIDMSEL